MGKKHKTIHDLNDVAGQRTINRTYERCWREGREPTLNDINRDWTKVFGNNPYKRMPKYDKSRERGLSGFFDSFFGK